MWHKHIQVIQKHLLPAGLQCQPHMDGVKFFAATMQAQAAQAAARHQGG
jgi:hypothetical protein